MEVKASCIRISLKALILLIGLAKQCYPQTSDSPYKIVPSKLQFFEYEPISFTCEGLKSLAGWRVRSMNETVQKCSNDTVTLAVTCIIDYAYEPDSGEYWCEGKGGRKSNTVNITVTSGLVILESPVLPLREGDSLTLDCKTRVNSSKFTVDFYRDGLLLQSSNAGQMTIERVSKSDEGLYKCNIAHVGMSPESWLVVRGHAVIMESPVFPVTEGEAVKLRCRERKTSHLRADFYKDGLLISSSSTGEMIIHSVSKSDKGLYKCRIFGAGESAERLLSIKAASGKGINFSHFYYILLWLCVTIILVLQLLLIGLLHRKKQLVTLALKMNDPGKNPHTTVKDDKKEKDAVYAADDSSPGFESNQNTKPQTEKVSSLTVTGLLTPMADPTLEDVDSQYNTIQEMYEEEMPY